MALVTLLMMVIFHNRIDSLGWILGGVIFVIAATVAAYHWKIYISEKRELHGQQASVSAKARGW